MIATGGMFSAPIPDYAAIVAAPLTLDDQRQHGDTGDELVVDTSNDRYGGYVQRMQGGQWRQVDNPQQRAQAWGEAANEIMNDMPMSPRIQAVPGGFPAPITHGTVDVYWRKDGGELELRGGKDNVNVLPAEELPDESLLNEALRHRRFVLPDEDVAEMEKRGFTELELRYNATATAKTANRSRRASTPFTIECHVDYQQPGTERKEPLPWQ